MEFTHKSEILYRLKKIEAAVRRLITQNENVKTANDYYCTPWGMERLESSCMLLIAVGESIKGLDKDTNKQLLPLYPEVDWKGAMGLRDIIAHHYFDIEIGLTTIAIHDSKNSGRHSIEQNINQHLPLWKIF